MGILNALWRIFFQTVPLALGQVWANKIRALLTALGIIIGISAVIIVVGALTGMQRFVLSEFETIGARKMWVWGEVPDSKEATLDWAQVKMTPFEAALLEDRSENIDLVGPICNTNEDIRFGDRIARGVTLRGIWPQWHEIEDRTVVHGRQLSRIDNEEKRQVCLINEAAIEELNLDNDPTGDILLVGSRRFLIIGVLETKEASMMFGGGQARSELFIPFETSKMMNPYSGTWFQCQTASPESADDAVADARFILRQQRGLYGEDEDTFGIQVLQNAISQFNQVAGVIGLIAVIIVLISLFVGGIGIMNIMLVSVSERTREIGLRKALGAQAFVVMLQFLVEAVVLCMLGAGVGLVIGLGSIAIMRNIPGVPLEGATVSPWAVGLSIGSCALVGVVAGMFPAIKAASLNPIDALRHE